MTTKMLVWSDYACSTGFSNVMSNILRRLPANDFEIDVVGINYNGDPDYNKSRYPGRIWPCITSLQKPYNDMYGCQKLLERIQKQAYDVLFVLQDTPIASQLFPKIIEAKEKNNRDFKLVYYFPLDSPPRMGWLKRSVGLADIPIAYTEYGASACRLALPELENKLRIIPHGVDIKDFYPTEMEVAEYRNALCFGADGWLLGNINRNQPRKDIQRSLLLLHELRKYRSDIYLYLHMSNRDIGGHLAPAANQLGLFEGKDYFLPPNFPTDGYPIDRLNIIYNMLDILITTSLGEGWGLSLTEAMATKVPVIAPDHTSITEILADGRGVLTPAGTNSTLWTMIRGDSGVLRPITDVEIMAAKILDMIEVTETGLDQHIKEMVDKAYRWVVTTLSWDKLVRDNWLEILSSDSD